MFLKNKNIIFKIRRSKVTDNAALKQFVYYIDRFNEQRPCLASLIIEVLAVLFC